METIKFPCKECDNSKLLPIPEYDLCECSVCGHPQDIPTAEHLEQFIILENNI